MGAEIERDRKNNRERERERENIKCLIRGEGDYIIYMSMMIPGIRHA